MRVMLLILGNLKTLLRHRKVSEILYDSLRGKFLLQRADLVNAFGLTIRLRKDDPQLAPVLYTLKVWEPSVTRLFFALLRPGDTVVDVGAFVGYYTLLASKLVGGSGKVYSFEPDPRSFELLKANAIANGFQNVFLHRMAAFDNVSERKLFVTRPTWATLFLDQRSQDKVKYEVTVPTVTLDSVIPTEACPIKLLKVDAESADAYVLRGARTLISRGLIDNIIAEYQGSRWFNLPDVICMLQDTYEAYLVSDQHYLIPQIPRRAKLSVSLNGIMWFKYRK
jgi:FkbM family methyltransferase